MTSRLDLDETVRDHASEQMRTVPKLIVPSISALGAIVSELFLRVNPSLGPWRWWFLPLSGLGAGFLAYSGPRLWFMLGAARHQRDAARTRLREIKRAASELSIVATEARSIPDGPGAIVQVQVRNEGRGALFAVVIESIVGSEEGLIDPFAPLYWMGRPNVLDEEIPPRESRVVGLGWLSGGGSRGLEFTPMSPDGTSHRRKYKLLKGTTTVRFLVSARGVPEFDYTRPISVSIRWEGPGNDPHIGDPTSEDAMICRFSPPVTKLLDFGPRR
ncbi:MAG: hypothetical protein GXP36_09950 [Actinobacteria bacterium]|nr:hypothetical protein [Actinomycetota bacterium]